MENLNNLADSSSSEKIEDLKLEESSFSSLSLFDFHLFQNIFIQLFYGNNFENPKKSFCKLYNFTLVSKLFLKISKETLFPIQIYQKTTNLNYQKYFYMLNAQQNHKEDKFKEDNVDDFFSLICEMGYYCLIDTLIMFGANVNSEYNPILTTIECGNLNCIEELLKQDNIDLNINYLGHTPLIAAINSKNINILKLLMTKEDLIKFNYRDYSGKTALMMAVETKNLDIVNIMIPKNNNMDFSIKDNRGKTALDYAKSRGSKDITELLEKYTNFTSVKH